MQRLKYLNPAFIIFDNHAISITNTLDFLAEDFDKTIRLKMLGLGFGVGIVDEGGTALFLVDKGAAYKGEVFAGKAFSPEYILKHKIRMPELKAKRGDRDIKCAWIISNLNSG